MSKNRKGHGVVVPFAQDAGFFLRRGDSKKEEGANLDAASFYRRAIEADPADGVAYFKLGELFAEMGCMELSNRYLLTALSMNMTEDAQLYFNLACNYSDLHRYDAAMICAREVLHLPDDGLQSSAEIRALFEGAFDSVDDDDIYDEATGKKLAKHTCDALSALGEGNNKKAIASFERAWAAAPASVEQACNLAMACYCDGQYNRALSVLNSVMIKDRNNLQLHSILALVYHAQKDEASLEREIRILRETQKADSFETMKVAISAFDVDREDIALELFEEELENAPDDVEFLHCAAICAYNADDRERAAELWGRAAKIDPQDPVLKYYIEKNADKENFRRITACTHEFPLDVVIERTRALHDMQEETEEQLLSRPNVMDVLDWALYKQDARRAGALSVLMVLDENRACRELKRLVADPTTGESEREMFLSMLSALGEKGPFIVMSEVGVAEVTINVFDGLEHLDPGFRAAPELFVRKLEQSEDMEQRAAVGLKLWQLYIAMAVQTERRMKDENVAAYAAALEYIVGRILYDGYTQSDMIEKYGTTKARFKRAYDELREAYDSAYEETEDE